VNNINQLDIDLLSGYVSSLGKNIVQQMLDLYVQQSEVYLCDINNSIKEQSQTLWQESCHKMKGATGSVGLSVVHAKLVGLEKSAEAWSIKQQLISELSQENEKAIASFNAWLITI